MEILRMSERDSFPIYGAWVTVDGEIPHYEEVKEGTPVRFITGPSYFVLPPSGSGPVNPRYVFLTCGKELFDTEAEAFAQAVRITYAAQLEAEAELRGAYMRHDAIVNAQLAAIEKETNGTHSVS